MKWAILTAVVLTVIFGLPFREYETQQLLPIKTLCAEYADGEVHIVSEVGEGRGSTWQAAVEDLKLHAAGDVFFDTAEQIVVTHRELALAAKDDLRPSAQVYFVKKLPEIDDLYAYLKAHPSGRTMEDL